MASSTAIVVLVLAVLFYYVTRPPVPFTPELLRGKNVIVTGASMGIGEQLAYEYATLGANVVLAARGQPQLEEVAAKARKLVPEGMTSRITPIVADLSQEDATQALIDAAASVFGGDVDVLVLNHVLGWWDWWLESVNYAKMRKIFEVNTFGYIYLATQAMPALERSGGSIVVVSSWAGKGGVGKVAPYAASKHALHGFFDSLRVELTLRQSAVSITTCVLGSIETQTAIANTKGDIDHLPRASARATAHDIMVGGASRSREIYTPHWELRPLAFLRGMSPEFVDWLSRRITFGAW